MSPLCVVVHYARTGREGGSEGGMVSDLLNLMLQFASSGADGIRPAIECAHLVLDLLMMTNMEFHKKERELLMSQLKLVELKGDWQRTIKQVKRLVQSLPKSEKRGVPLEYFDALTCLLEVNVLTIHDHKFWENFFTAGARAAAGVTISVLMGPTPSNLREFADNLGRLAQDIS